MSQLQPPKAPRLPNAPSVYMQAQFDALMDILRRYFVAQDAVSQQLLAGFNHYGYFLNTTTETASAINTAMLVAFDTQVDAFGITVVGSPATDITVATGGVYKVTISAQLDNLAGGTQYVDFWFRINGVDVQYSAKKTAVTGVADQRVAAFDALLALASGDVLQLLFAVSSTNVVLTATAAAAPVPASASVAMSIQYVWPAGTI